MQAAPMRGAPSSVRVTSPAPASPFPPSAPRVAAPCRVVRHTRRPYTPGSSRRDEVVATDAEDCDLSAPRGAAGWRRAAAAVGVALSLAVASAGPVLAATPPPAVEDETLLSDFDVRFLGLEVDHRVIVEWVVAGQTIGFIGSAVAGLSAAERKREVELLNTRLLTVNKQLREKARSSQAALQHASEPEPVVGADGVDDVATDKVLTTLRAAKSMLKLRDGSGAKKQFEEALGLVQKHEASLEAPWKARRKALRGLGASCQMLGEHDAALRHMQLVLTISEEHGDVSGAADAIGVIADVYTDKGDLDNAGKWYDRYIEAMNA